MRRHRAPFLLCNDLLCPLGGLLLPLPETFACRYCCALPARYNGHRAALEGEFTVSEQANYGVAVPSRFFRKLKKPCSSPPPSCSARPSPPASTCPGTSSCPIRAPYFSLAVTSIKLPSGKVPTTLVLRLISRLMRSIPLSGFCPVLRGSDCRRESRRSRRAPSSRPRASLIPSSSSATSAAFLEHASRDSCA